MIAEVVATRIACLRKIEIATKSQAQGFNTPCKGVEKQTGTIQATLEYPRMRV